jgi:hypothetical protein
VRSGCEVFKAPPSLGRQLEARQRAGRRAASESTVVDALLPTGPVSLTRRLSDGLSVAVWPDEPGLTPAPTLLRRRHLLLHGSHRLARRRLARRRRGAATRGAAMRSAACAAPPAPSAAQRRRRRALRSAACAALPLPRRLRRDASAATPHAALPRAAPTRRRLARLRLAPRRLARVRPCLRPARAGPVPARRLVWL